MRIERLKFLGSFSVAICDDKNFKPIYIYIFFFLVRTMTGSKGTLIKLFKVIGPLTST